MEKEKIVNLFKTTKKTLTYDQIKVYFSDHKNLSKSLDELTKEGIIFKKNLDAYALSEQYHLISATVIKSNNNETIVKDNEEKTYKIKWPLFGLSIFNDKVLIGFNNREPYVRTILEEYKGPFIGQIKIYKNIKYIYSINPCFSFRIKTNNDSFLNNQIVSFNIVSRFPKVVIDNIENIGYSKDPNIRLKVLLKERNERVEFNNDVLKEVELLDDFNINDHLENRVDLTNHLICTIDGKDAKDLDDAIEVAKEENCYILGVHIADVSNFVYKYSALDKEALKRANSMYLANTVIPMLPFKLSNDLCSLNPNTVKLTMSLYMKIDFNGKVIDYDICESFIKSSYRLNYVDVNKFYNNELSYDNDLETMLISSKELSDILKNAKHSRGEIDLDIKEPELIYDLEGNAIDIKASTRGIAERLIEDFMVVANETIASHIYYEELPFIYRVHEEPSFSKYSDLRVKLLQLGIRTKSISEDINPKMYQEILENIDLEEVKNIASIYILRSMSKARYDLNNYGHFGLASCCYTHFTSPIRRYSDLLVHRLLKMYMHNEKYNIEHLYQEISYIADSISDREIKTLELERKVEDIKISQYMKKFVGTNYIATVTSIIGSGLFVQLDNLVEGMISFYSMSDDYYLYDETNNVIVGQSNKKIIKIGDKIKVKLINCDTINGKIDFLALDFIR